MTLRKEDFSETAIDLGIWEELLKRAGTTEAEELRLDITAVTKVS